MFYCFPIIFIFFLFSPNWYDDPFGDPSNERLEIDVLIPSVGKLIGSNEDCVCCKVDLSSFGFHEKWVSITQSEQQVER